MPLFKKLPDTQIEVMNQDLNSDEAKVQALKKINKINVSIQELNDFIDENSGVEEAEILDEH